ncbi:hypothetical protein LK12_06350 [Novosphingobium malaysiense]|uniref:Uncharacterized protein n=1 Tax=Novosphingobium malaysiense TaxID=1348853 RepID=A0A0B1ZTF6_9SPHN|nr:hypothetical protein LK12_06350 [Novosphingobium malaysiense]
MYGGGTGTIAICGCSQQVRFTILRTRLVVRGFSLRTMRLAFLTGCAVLAILTLRYSVLADCVSATWTAPPPMTAQPAAQADNFARAIRTDISDALSVSLWISCPRKGGATSDLTETTQSPVNGTTALTQNRASQCENFG